MASLFQIKSIDTSRLLTLILCVMLVVGVYSTWSVKRNLIIYVVQYVSLYQSSHFFLFTIRNQSYDKSYISYCG